MELSYLERARPWGRCRDKKLDAVVLEGAGRALKWHRLRFKCLFLAMSMCHFLIINFPDLCVIVLTTRLFYSSCDNIPAAYQDT
jgi:hypothetical protein